MKRLVLILAAVMMISSCACRNESKQAAETNAEMENTVIAEPQFEMVTSHGTMKIMVTAKPVKSAEMRPARKTASYSIKKGAKWFDGK